MAPFEALFGRRCRSLVFWDDFTEAATLGPELLLQMTEQVKLIRDMMKADNDRQKSYADLKRRPEEFEVGEQVLLRVSLMHGVVHRLALGSSALMKFWNWWVSWPIG